MKATSIRLEVFVRLKPEEFEKLKNGSLSGDLKFYDDPSPPKNIPIEIIYDSKQKEFLNVETKPKNNYFGKAKDIKFRINDEYYDYVTDNGVFSDRFHTGGKLIMSIEGRYSLY